MPGKNVAEFNGTPLIVYSLECGLQSEVITDVVVSSNDPKVMEICELYDVHCLQRPESISGDYATTSDVILHVADAMGLHDDDFIVTLQPTNPLRTRTLIEEAFAFGLAFESEWDCLISVSPIEHKFGTVDKGLFRPTNYQQGQRSQDLADAYFYENGLVYITPVRTLTTKGNMFGQRKLAYLVEGEYATVDIDHPIDFEIGELLHKSLAKKYDLI